MNYVDIADVRIITRADILAHGLTDPGVDLVWTKDNSYELDVTEDVAVFLMAQGDFVSDAGLNFGELVQRLTARSELGYAELTSVFDVIGAATDIAGLTLNVEVKDRPIYVCLEGPFGNTTGGQGCLPLLYRDLVTNIGAAQVLQVNTAAYPWFHMRKRQSLAPGDYTFNAKLARFNSGTARINASATSPASIYVIEA